MSDTSAGSHIGTMPAADLPVSSSGLPAGDAPSSALVSIRNVDILAHVPVRLDFDADNYAEWKDAMLSVLAEFSATDHVEEHGRAPGHGDDDWTRADVTVVLWIYTTISDELLDEVMSAHSTAREVWTRLRGFFDYEYQDGFDVGEEFRNAAQGDMSVGDYCWRLKALADALAGQGEPVDDRALTMQMIRGLSPRWAVMGAALLGRASFPSFRQASSWLRLEEYKEVQGVQCSSPTRQ
ncbi:unnamed protein product [Alopecurus aequalis]